MSIFWTLLFGSLLAVGALYVFFLHRFSYWRKRGVPGPAPVFPFGNLKKMFTKRANFGAICRDIYEETKHLPYVGFYMLHRPALQVNDPELARTIMVKDFMHFTDHGFEFNFKTQPLADHLFNTNGARWKGLRTKLSPVFTSSKMKYMFEIMADCGEDMRKYMKQYAESGEEFDAKEAVAKFTTNAIASCAFGIDSNCFENPDCELRTLGKRVFDMDFKRNFAMFMVLFTPSLYKKLDLKIIEDRVQDYFISVVEDTIKYREENNVTRNDLMQLLIKLKNNERIDDAVVAEAPKESKDTDVMDVHLDQLELAAQAFGFFVGGFETTSTATSFILYELAKNTDVQSKVRDEIESVLEKHGGKITYEAVMDLHYMTQVIDETLRIHPIVPQIFRVCTKNYTLPGTDILIEKGTIVLIPNEGFQMDPTYFNDPEVFNPENFTSENKGSRNHYTYLPFGEGPRMCIGFRFAMIQMKIALLSILREHEVELGKDKTLKIATNASFLLSPVDLYVTVKKRS